MNRHVGFASGAGTMGFVSRKILPKDERSPRPRKMLSEPEPNSWRIPMLVALFVVVALIRRA